MAILEPQPYTVVGQSGYATLSAAVTALNAYGLPCTLVVPKGTYDVTSMTFNSNINLVVNRGAILQNTGTYEYTVFNCTIEAGAYQIFSVTGGGHILLRRGVANEFPLRWWGAVGDGTTDDTAAIQLAVDTYFYGEDVLTYHASFTGSPNDTYLVTNITMNKSTGTYPGKVILDGKGAVLKKSGVGTTDILTSQSSGLTTKIENWVLVGSCQFVFNHAGAASKPSSVYFQTADNVWHLGRDVSTVGGVDQSACVQNYDWFYDASNLLHVYADGGTILNPAFIPEHPTRVYQAVSINGTGTPLDSTAWHYSLYASGIGSEGVGHIYVEHCTFHNLDRGIRFWGTEWCSVNNCVFDHTNCAFWCNSSGSIAGITQLSNITTNKCFGDNAAYPTNFWLMSRVVTLINIDVEMSRASMLMAGGDSLTVQGMYIEGTCYYHNPTALYAFDLEHIGGADISAVSFDLSEAGGYPTSLTHALHFKDSSGIDIHGCSFFDPTLLVKVYKYEETAGHYGDGGITIRNSNIQMLLDGSTPTVVKLENNGWGQNAIIPQSPALVTLGLPITEWGTNNSYVSLPPGGVTCELNVTATIDATTGFSDSNSLKLAFTDTHDNKASWGVATVPASGNWGFVSVFAIKSDTNMTLSIGEDTYTLDVIGDSQWRIVYTPSTDVVARSGGGMPTSFASNTIGNIWIDDWSVKWFQTAAECQAYVGQYDLS